LAYVPFSICVLAGADKQVNAVHLAYAILGGYVCVFSLVSLFIKEKLYIGEASISLIIPLSSFDFAHF